MPTSQPALSQGEPDEGELFIGLMSGTSLDGLDAVLVRMDAGNSRPLDLQTLAFASTPYTDSYRQALTSLLCPGDNELERAAQLAVEHADISAATVKKLLSAVPDIHAGQVMAIGNHGQTVRHVPHGKPPYSLQITNGAHLAEKSGITTITDFRSRDIAAGGQGAPLVPAFHQQLLGQSGESRVIVNIGGIANITLLDGRVKEADSQVVGFDTGPGNTLMDGWIGQHQQKNYDENGDWARSGVINNALLERFKQDDYFSKLPPKSTGRELFNMAWLHRFDGLEEFAPEDVQASLCALTAWSIAQAITRHAQSAMDGVYVCGGGAYNTYLMALIADNLSAKVQTTKVLGFDPQCVEAVAFAWLARQALHGLPGNLPSVTGALKAVVLGAVYLS